MNAKERQFVETVWKYYHDHGRHDLPWRMKSHLRPYNILVSEVMLQQTQVERVVPKYQSFMKQWPTVRRLSTASLGDVLRVWQGLGYNRRAKLLHQCAITIQAKYSGRFPKTYQKLSKLPGVGPYTAGAVMAFAYNEAVPMIETNIRTVYLHHFFKDVTDVSDTDLLQYIEMTLDRKNPREWYWALMDYGTHLKHTRGNLNSKSRHYSKQSRFVGSDREIRGAILRMLIHANAPRSRTQLHRDLTQFEDVRIDAQLENLVREELLTHSQGRYALPR